MKCKLLSPGPVEKLPPVESPAGGQVSCGLCQGGVATVRGMQSHEVSTGVLWGGIIPGYKAYRSNRVFTYVYIYTYTYISTHLGWI